MKSLVPAYRIRLDMVPTAYIRAFHDEIDWDDRLVCILGQNGVGKSTMILQHIRFYDKPEESLYVQADDFYFAGNRIYDLAVSFFSQGGRKLYIDNIHKYSGWAEELRMVYDRIPLLKVVCAGNSLLGYQQEASSLSGIHMSYTMPILSFREYLNISFGWNLKPSSLDDILRGKVDFPYGKHRPLDYYREYLRYGCYPYSDEEDFPIRLREAVNSALEDDIPQYMQMTMTAASKLKKLMFMLAHSVPDKPNHRSLASELNISRNMVPTYIDCLEKCGLLNALCCKPTGESLSGKTEKLYLNNPNLIFTLGLDGMESLGGFGGLSGFGGLGGFGGLSGRMIRQTMFLAWMKRSHCVTSSRVADFEIGDMIFDLSGARHTHSRPSVKIYTVADDIECASGSTIPIWMFGFIY